MDDIFNVGDIVLSKMGRDSGRHYIIMDVEGNYACICDGDRHKVDKPKKKKLKHIKSTGEASDYIAGKLAEGTKVTNAELRRAVLEFEEISTQV